jgi:hypothetical protein
VGALEGEDSLSNLGADGLGKSKAVEDGSGHDGGGYNTSVTPA